MKIDDEVKILESQMEVDKKYFWEHPEPGLNELETSTYIVNRLKQIGYTDINTNIYSYRNSCYFKRKK